MYGLAARAVRISADRLTYRYLLRPEARFHDGTKLTAHDVAFSLNLLKEKGHPIIGQMTRDFVGAEAEDDATVVLQFRAEARARRAAVRRRPADLLARLLFDARISKRPRSMPPLGSGAYKVGRFESGRYIEYDRVKDWWGAELPIVRGQYNFDVVRFEFYRDRDVAFEGFTGKSYLFREEFTARIWATRYDFPAIKDGRVKQSDPARRHALRRAGLVHEHAARQVQEPRTARSPDPGVRFRVDQQVHHVRRLQAHLLGVPEFQHDRRGQAGARPSSHCSSRSAARCPTRCSASRSCRRCRTGRARTARCCARRRNCCSRPAIRSRTASASTPRASRSRSSS